ncbi:MAG TPA: septal ring lytic transglycosylase RlpA family protein, partial [Rhodocyclaceae bacterium]|nr:septal ring lytic transglycosylase RlpA family protein [Rhodocyclaceae bacterium]
MKISAVCLPSFFLPATFALLLAACASTPPATPLAPPHAPITTTPEAAKTPLPSIHPEPSNIAKRPGGYYKDDGPGDNPPPNLGDIPNAQPRVEALNRYANRPYVALGQSYSPRQQVVPFVERGLASWYGKRFQGVRTSSGEPYDMYAMTAAHPTLPIPSYARVTNLENGRSVIVRINDRGPFHKDRIMDLSYTAAWKLGYVDKGSAQVE